MHTAHATQVSHSDLFIARIDCSQSIVNKMGTTPFRSQRPQDGRRKISRLDVHANVFTGNAFQDVDLGYGTTR